LDFIRHHKRTTRNFMEVLEELIHSDKQTIVRGVKGSHQFTVNYIKLNKACSVMNCWWSLTVIGPQAVADEVR